MKLNNGQKIGLLGSILAVVGIFLPWASILGFSILGIQVGIFAYLALLFGILALIGSILSGKKGAIILLVFGIIGLVWMLLFLGIFTSMLAAYGGSKAVSMGLSVLGIGYWLTLVGFIIAMIGGIMDLKELKSAPPTLSEPEPQEEMQQF